METKRDKFVRLAEKRMDSILKGIELMGNLSNTNNYEYTQEDINKIIKEYVDMQEEAVEKLKSFL